MEKAKIKTLKLNSIQCGILIESLNLLIDDKKSSLQFEYEFNLDKPNNKMSEFEENVKLTNSMESQLIVMLQLSDALKKLKL